MFADYLIFRDSLFFTVDPDQELREFLSLPDILGIKGDNLLVFPDCPVQLPLGNELLCGFK